MDRVRQLENRVAQLERLIRKLQTPSIGPANAARFVLATGAVSGTTGKKISDPNSVAAGDKLKAGSGTVKLLSIGPDGKIEYMLDENGDHVERTAYNVVQDDIDDNKMLILGRLPNKALIVIGADCDQLPTPTTLSLVGTASVGTGIAAGI